MNEITARLKELGVVPVVAVERAADAASLGDVLVEGGLPCVELWIGCVIPSGIYMKNRLLSILMHHGKHGMPILIYFSIELRRK